MKENLFILSEEVMWGNKNERRITTMWVVGKRNTNVSVVKIIRMVSKQGEGKRIITKEDNTSRKKHNKNHLSITLMSLVPCHQYFDLQSPFCTIKSLSPFESLFFLSLYSALPDIYFFLYLFYEFFLKQCLDIL